MTNRDRAVVRDRNPFRGLKSGGFETFHKLIAACPEEGNCPSGPVWSAAACREFAGCPVLRTKLPEPVRGRTEASISVLLPARSNRVPDNRRHLAPAFRTWSGRPLVSMARNCRAEAIDSPIRYNRHCEPLLRKRVRLPGFC